jgi:hypothetical protein
MIKSSFRDDLCQEHASLLERLSGLEEAIESAHGDTVADHLGAVRTHLLHHFEFEESGGYMKHVLDRAPHLHLQAQELLAEHGRMRKQVDDLLAQVSGLAANRPLPDAFRHRVRDLLEFVRKHEARENRLVQETLNQDLGVDD